MKKLDIGELVNDNYSMDEVVEYLAASLPTTVKALTEGITAQNWGAIGAANAQLANLTTITNSLNEKVNGKKEGTVL